MVNDQSEAYELYKKWGVPVSPHNREVTSFKEILDMIDYYGEHRGDIEHRKKSIPSCLTSLCRWGAPDV